MQAVLLVAGKGTRMGVATKVLPKPLLEARGKTLLEHKLDMLPSGVSEIVLVVGFHGGLIRDKIGIEYRGRPVVYVEQNECDGTAGALLCAKDVLGEEFLVMMGDDIYDKADVESCMKERWAVCAKKIEQKEMGGELLLDKKRRLVGSHEARHFVDVGYINTGLYKLQKKYFDYEPQKVTGTKEYGIPQTLVVCAKDIPISVVISQAPWIQITDQEDLHEFDISKR